MVKAVISSGINNDPNGMREIQQLHPSRTLCPSMQKVSDIGMWHNSFESQRLGW
jgi:hypothetical protein